jgi:hypothetical protein
MRAVNSLNEISVWVYSAFFIRTPPAVGSIAVEKRYCGSTMIESLSVHSPLLTAKFVKISMMPLCLQRGISSNGCSKNYNQPGNSFASKRSNRGADGQTGKTALLFFGR